MSGCVDSCVLLGVFPSHGVQSTPIRLPRSSKTERVEMQETLIDNLVLILYPLLRDLSSVTSIRGLLRFLQSLVLKHRKQLVTICRSGCVPIVDTSIYTRCIQIILILRDSEYQDMIYNLVCDPLLTGLLVTLCISMPMSSKAIADTYSEMLAKEMLVMESSPLPSALNYRPFFGEYQEPIHPSVMPNPRQAAMIHMLINQWIVSIEEQSYILPHMTSKLCSKSTQEEVRDRYPDYMTFEEEGATQPDLEIIYMRFGDELLENSSSEVKQRWYSSILTPRTYYAAGSKAYHQSKYVRNALNSLCDFLPPTERFSRVNPHRIILSSPHSHAYIYDLTSFTSNMHEQRHFLSSLSSYCRGHTVRILDAVEGVIEKDLGELLNEYNEMNTEPQYSSTKLLGKDLVLSHHIAGFLGVFGNLASCTFLHGAVVSQLVASFSQLGVAGDDGCIESSDDYTTFFVIRLLGLMEDSKVYSTDESGNQVYLKRPIRQVGSRLFSDSFALYSMIEHLFEEDDKRFFPFPRSKYDRKGSLASSIVAYLFSLTRILLDLDQKERILRFLTGVYEHANFPVWGNVPQIHIDHHSYIGKLPGGIVPTICLESIGVDPMEFTIKSLYSGVAVLPDRTMDKIPIDYDELFLGSSFVSTGSPILSYYKKLGFVELDQEEVVITGEDGLRALLKYYSPSKDYPVYNVHVISEIPDHLLP